NNQIANLNTPLRSGDMCEIIVEKNRQGPNADWLKFVKTQHAREKIRDSLKKTKKSFFSGFMGRK
ncbi:hypothetical protein KKH24_03830, partial [Patescibacteria group bacterium]|nr:hypothetical protein [Patescibacteria group bacterium]